MLRLMMNILNEIIEFYIFFINILVFEAVRETYVLSISLKLVTYGVFLS